MGILWPHIRRELGGTQGRIRVLDVACGGGEVLSAIVSHGRGRIDGIGIDRSPVAIGEARRRARGRASFRVMDALDESRPLPPADVVMCSLFLHHLTGPDAMRLLARMHRAAGRLVVVSDLERAATNRWLVALAARIVSRSPIVHGDAVQSVGAGWKAAELAGLARRAGLHAPTVLRAFPARLLLLARCPGSREGAGKRPADLH